MLTTDTDILKAAEDWRKQGRDLGLGTASGRLESGHRPGG